MRRQEQFSRFFQSHWETSRSSEPEKNVSEKEYYLIFRDKWNPITMTGQGVHPKGSLIEIHGTYAFNYGISFHDDTNKEWIYTDSWKWV